MTSTTITRPRATARYKALIAVGLNDNQALKAMGVVNTEPEPTSEFDKAVALLVEAGFGEDEARIIVTDNLGAGAMPSPAVAAEPTAKERADALVAERGYTFTKGRVYVTGEILESAARVLKGKGPEVVATSGVGRVAAVLIHREESGDVSIQNLAKPSA